MVQISLDTTLDLERTQAREIKLAEEAESLKEAAHLDQLTGIANRREFDRKLDRVIQARMQSQRASALGLLIMDIDHFKSFNDTHGHLVGDAVLKSVAGWLQNATRQTDFLARYGGEEFVVIVPYTEIEILKTIAERIRSTVQSGTVEHNGMELKVTISVGGTCVDQISAETDGNELLKMADECLYEAKQNGRNQSVCRGLTAVVNAGT